MDHIDGKPFAQMTRQELIDELHYWERKLDDEQPEATRLICRRHADRCLEFLRGGTA